MPIVIRSASDGNHHAVRLRENKRGVMVPHISRARARTRRVIGPPFATNTVVAFDFVAGGSARHCFDQVDEACVTTPRGGPATLLQSHVESAAE